MESDHLLGIVENESIRELKDRKVKVAIALCI